MSDQVLYHGTQRASAYAIMRQGFRVGEETMGRNLGVGLYLTACLGFAAVWGPMVIRCRLRPGTRMLWHTPVDERTIKYLQKEFGASITQPTFDRVIPLSAHSYTRTGWRATWVKENVKLSAPLMLAQLREIHERAWRELGVS